MDLLERFRRHTQRWEHADPSVRAEAVREEVRLEDQELLARIASNDPDPRVRRAAVRKLLDVAALVAAGADGDEAVREAATEVLLGLALGSEAGTAGPAVGALSEVRALVAVARSALLQETRLAALGRVSDARHLATLAKTAEDAAVRSTALRRVEDPALLADVAAKSDHKATAVAAVERVFDADALRFIAARAVHKAASRRAQAKLDALQPAVPPAAPEPSVAEPESEKGAALVQAETEAIAEPASAIAEGAPDPVLESAVEPALEPASLPASVEPPEVSGVTVDVDVTPPAAAAQPEPPPVSQEAIPGADVPAPAAPVEGHEASVARSVSVSVVTPPREDPERARRERTHRAEAVCARVERLAHSRDLTLRDAETALREARALHEEPGLPGKVEHRLKLARAALFARAQELREADEWTRWANAAIQEELCAKVEALAASEDLEKAASDLHAADARWAAARHAPRDQAEALRRRYQAARAALKPRLDAHFASKAAAQAARLQEKLALCERATALAESTDWLRTSDEIKKMQARWKEIGPAAPRDERLAWKRFHAACDRFFTRRQEDLKRRKDEWSANLARKQALCVKAETLGESSDWEKTAAEVRRLQAAWKSIGPVRRSQSEAVWGRFRKACDVFFERYKRREEIAAGARRAEREALCRELEELAPEGTEPPSDLAERVLALTARARQAPALPVADEEELTRRLVTARNRLIAVHAASFNGTELDPEANRLRREKLCARVETLAASGGQAEAEVLTGENLARRLKEALAANTIGGRVDVEARRRAERAEVESAQAAWKRLGPVPGEVGASLEARFNAACSRFFGAHRGTDRSLSAR
jgi:hypothetical protein